MLRNTFDMMIHYLRLTYGERSTLIFQIAMPLLFTFLVGQATGGFGGGGTISSTAVTWTVAVVNEDGGAYSTLLVDGLQADPTLVVALVADVDTAVTQVEDGAVTAALVIPAAFSQQLAAGQGANLDFYSDPANTRQVQPVQEAVNAAISQLQGALTVAAISADTAAELGLFDQGAEPVDYRLAAVQLAQTAWQHPPTAVQINEDELVISVTDIIPNGINQSSPGMMAMFATFGMLGGAAVLIQERQWGTLRRLAVMPIRKGSIIGGKLLGIVTAGVLQMVILIIAGALLFRVAWGNSPAALALMVASFALAMSGLGMMMAALVKTIAQANALGTVLVLSMSALGGAWWPLEIVPDWLQTVGKLSPIYWAMSGFQDIITRGWGVTAVLPEVLVLAGFTAVFLGIGLWRFKYE
ncbi:MAG: ABC transporter permease [Anaerolineae bacterium]|nr:ABC transporter permease [Anaerolineae bacterium]